MSADGTATPGSTADGFGLPWDGLTRGLWLATAVLVYLRLFVGVDVTDESFYSSLPYSFVLGLRPYHDELNITQNAGILLAPFVKLHGALVGSTAGLVLYNRHLYFLLLAGCSYLTFRAAVRYVGSESARLLAAFVLTFSYCNIPSLSYNTLGALFLFAGLMLLLDYAAPGRPARASWVIFGANLCFVVSAFGYPTLVVSSLTGFAVSGWLVRQRSRADRLAWWSSLAFGGTAALGFVAWTGLDDLRATLGYAASYGYDLVGGAPRIAHLIGSQFRNLGLYLAGGALLLALPILPAGILRTKRIAYLGAAVAGSAVVLFLVYRQPTLESYPAASAPVLLVLGLLAPLVLCLLPDRRGAAELALVVGAPAFVAGAAVAFSSTSGLPAAVLGMFPAAVCSLLGVAMIARSLDAGGRANGVRAVAVLGMLGPLLVFQICALWARCYRDAPFAPGAQPTFASGPFAGLVTSEANARRLAALASDLKALGTSARTLFVYDRFPAAYLMSSLKPRTFSTWIFWPTDPVIRAGLIRRVFAAAEPPPDAILQIGPRPPWVDAEIQRLKYKVLLERPEFNYVLLLREPD